MCTFVMAPPDCLFVFLQLGTHVKWQADGLNLMMWYVNVLQASWCEIKRINNNPNYKIINAHLNIIQAYIHDVSDIMQVILWHTHWLAVLPRLSNYCPTYISMSLKHLSLLNILSQWLLQPDVAQVQSCLVQVTWLPVCLASIRHTKWQMTYELCSVEVTWLDVTEPWYL